MYLSEKELEEIADQVFQDYAKLPAAWDGSMMLRVKPELLLEGLLGLKVAYCDMHELEPLLCTPPGQVTLGFTCFSDDTGDWLVEDLSTGEYRSLSSRTVVLEQALLQKGERGRRNFTMVHEGCHHILWHLFPETRPKRPPGLACRFVGGPFSPEEWQADRLASSILMPRYLVEHAMFRCQQHEPFDILDAGIRPKEYERFCNMCGMLGVSKQALGIRLKRLGLVGEISRYPFQAIDIFMEEDKT